MRNLHRRDRLGRRQTDQLGAPPVREPNHQPAAVGDGRLPAERGRHRARGHQPAGRSGPGAAPSGAVRRGGGGADAGLYRPQGNPDALPEQGPEQGHQHRSAGAGYDRVYRGGHREYGEPGGVEVS